MVLHRVIQAVREGDLSALRELSSSRHLTVTASISDSQGAGPVHHAARCGRLDCLRYLVAEVGLAADARALNRATPAHDAAATGHGRELQWLVDQGGCHVEDQDAAGATALHLASRFGRVDVVCWLLSNGSAAEVVTNCGAVPAHYAAAKGDLTCLKLLFGHAPWCVNRQTSIGATPLYLACQEGHLHIVEYLVKDCGADVHLRAQDGMTALHAAAQMGHYSLVVWLATFTDLSLHCQDREGATALHFAASGGHHRILERLLRMGAKVIRDYWGGTPLHDAAENGELECCRILLANRVSPSEQDVDGFTAADLAEYNGHYRCAGYIRALETCPFSAHRPVEKLGPVEEDVRVRQAVTWHPSKEDYYRSLSDTRRDKIHSYNNTMMETLENKMVRKKMTVDLTKIQLGGKKLHCQMKSSAAATGKMVSFSKDEKQSSEMPTIDLTKNCLGLGGNKQKSTDTSNTSKTVVRDNPSVEAVNINNQLADQKHLKEMNATATATEAKVQKEMTIELNKVQLGGIKLLTDNKSPATSTQVSETPKPQSLSSEGARMNSPVIADLTNNVQLGTTKLCAEIKSAASAHSSRMVVLPMEEANLSEIDYLVPTHDERGQPIAEWKRQVMVHQLQARLLDEEDQRRKENGNTSKAVSWRYSQTHNAILGPFGELLTEDDLIYLEKQIESVSNQKNSAGYESELARLAQELRTILPAPIVNITASTQFRSPNQQSQVPLPVWCNRISGIVQSMSLLMTNLTDAPYSKMPNTELSTVFTQTPGRHPSTRGRREKIESEIHQFGVSVRNLKSNFEGHEDEAEGEVNAVSALKEGGQRSDVTGTQDNSQETDRAPGPDQDRDSGIGRDNNVVDVRETTSLRKERIVVLFLGHWKKSAYTVTQRTRVAGRTASEEAPEKPKGGVDGRGPGGGAHVPLRHFFKQRSIINKMICDWRSMISSVPSRQIRRLNRQQTPYSPEQFLPKVDGATVDYDSLTLDLFMLGYFHILELELPADERKTRHLLCFEVFDHIGRFTWETVREFHKAVMLDIEAGKREWKDGFEDIKVKFFGSVGSISTSGSEKPPEVKERLTLPEVKRVPKVIIQTPTPDEESLIKGSDISSFSNEEISCLSAIYSFYRKYEQLFPSFASLTNIDLSGWV
ncbi:hypothetical protein DPEC_G00272090 [Dallia pectoralis]|uniref:Uncharacterized protein n=1 Tax=Dallia pectoralis TaxID=75939 RepID=A0ACC2FPW1_DALPE|nr:hypothetical protein DPEC_G00272090 [Dallia pectoralis]